MSGKEASKLNTMTTAESEALSAFLSATRDQAMDGAVRAPADPFIVKSLSPWQIELRLRKQLEAGVARLKAGPNFAAPRPQYNGPDVRIGFDAEWVTIPDGKGGYCNEVLCVTAVTKCGDLKSHYIFYPTGPARSDRPTMKAFFQAALRQAFNDKVIASMPAQVVVFGHFMRGDLASFEDFWAQKKDFRGLGKTLVSGPEGHLFEIEDVRDGNAGKKLDERASGDEGASSRQHQIDLRDSEGRRFAVRFRFMDTIRLTPGGRGLAYAGKMVGRPKLDLHKDLGIPAVEAVERPECIGMSLPARYGIGRMDLVMRDYPDQARAYALQDAEIALDYGVWMELMATQQFGLQRLPNTLAGIASAVVRNLSGGSADLASLIGRSLVTETRFNEKSRNFRTVKREVPSPGLELYYQFAANAYHGGRNECFYHGPTDVGLWYDYDLPGAYTTALVALRPIDYDNIRQELDPDAYRIDDMGFAWIEFEFPPGTRMPCIPVRGQDGQSLFFPLKGDRGDNVYVASPEIYLARRMGARIKIFQGFKAPWKSNDRIFEAFTLLVQSKRREFPKRTHPALNELWKEVGNSAYGLTAQGLKPKNAFDPKSMRSQPVGPSALTEPFMAAWTTSFIRAVLGEILAGVPADGTVVTATTDGLLTNVPLARLKLDGPLCTYFADIRERLFGRREVLDPEPKHGARQLISIAVRTTFTAIKAPGFELVCAKGSVRPDVKPEPVLQNRYMRRLYLGNHYGMQVTHEQLISAREQLTRELDLVGVKRTRTLNLRYDFKRRPVEPRMVRIGPHLERIAWNTTPWRTLSEAMSARVHVRAWCANRTRVFVNMDDYLDWQGYFEASLALREACESAGIRALQVRSDNAWGVLKRVFLQAGRQGAWGIRFERRGLTSVAKMFSEAGFETGKEDITYALRRGAPLLPHCVPWVPETEALLRVILEHFPDFEYRQAFQAIAELPNWLIEIEKGRAAE